MRQRTTTYRSWGVLSTYIYYKISMCNVMWRTRAHTSTYIYYIISMCNGAHAHAHACTHTACVTSAMFSINTSMQCACTVVVWVSGCSGVTVCLVGVNVLRMLVVPPLPSSPPSPPNTRRAGQEYQGLLPGLHRARIPSCLE